MNSFCDSCSCCPCSCDNLPNLGGGCGKYNPTPVRVRLPGELPRPSFISTITNVSSVTATTNPGFVYFFMRETGGVITLDWEPFTATLNANGISSLVANGAITSLPPFPKQVTLRLQLRGINRLGYVEVNPNTSAQIIFYLDFSGSAVGNINDIVNIPSGTIQWVDC